MYLFKLQFSPDICLGVGLLDHKVTLFLVFPEWLLQLTFPPTLRDPFPAHRAHSHSLIITETWKLGVWLKIFSLVHR